MMHKGASVANLFTVRRPTFLSDFKEIWIFSTYINKPPVPNFTEICLVGARLMHTVRQTERETEGRMDKIETFREYPKAPKNDN